MAVTLNITISDALAAAIQQAAAAEGKTPRDWIFGMVRNRLVALNTAAAWDQIQAQKDADAQAAFEAQRQALITSYGN